MAPRGRPRLTPAEYEERLRSYCGRYGVAVTPAGIPPFPSGQRETDQHREWLALYKAHSRLGRVQAQEPAADGSCGVCGRLVDPADSIAHRNGGLHAACHAVVVLAEPLGPAGFDRLRAYLWPAPHAKGSPRRTRKPRAASA